ncbi:MAG TPA: PepSY-associated TM helix domain-containing protein, partial [Methylocella sp.]|nr:PepSY-associated TM helix domain-containing protein [Methylocella sp.]
RWAGLLMTVFLIVVGLTGSLLAFKTDLERLICPRIYAAPRPSVPPLDFATLAERAEALVPQGQVITVALEEPDQALVVFEPREDPATGKPYKLDFVQMFVDPWTGEELGRRRPGDLSQGLINLMPFIWDLHLSLALGGWGAWVLGIVALVWTLDCFIGFYLTLPVSSGAFWRRWKPAWLVKRKAGAYRLNFDLHRAGGLWFWVILFIFAWSSVMLNLRPVYDWVTGAVFDYQQYTPPAAHDTVMSPHPPRLDFRTALSTGERLMAEQAAKHGFSVERPIMFYRMNGVYSYFVKSSRDIRDKLGLTYINFDADTGALISLELPVGEHSGNTISAWLYGLHMGDVFGLPYRIFVCALGLVITMLSVTGIYIWWKKRRARQFSKAHRGVAAAEVVAE